MMMWLIGSLVIITWKEVMQIEVARMVNVTYNDETGQVFVLMEIIDPAIKADLLRGDVTAKLVIEEDDDE
jgi:hypothetical protein